MNDFLLDKEIKIVEIPTAFIQVLIKGNTPIYPDYLQHWKNPYIFPSFPFVSAWL